MSCRTGTAAASASAQESPACGRSTVDATSPSRSDWSLISNTPDNCCCSSPENITEEHPGGSERIGSGLNPFLNYIARK